MSRKEITNPVSSLFGYLFRDSLCTIWWLMDSWDIFAATLNILLLGFIACHKTLGTNIKPFTVHFVGSQQFWQLKQNIFFCNHSLFLQIIENECWVGVDKVQQIVCICHNLNYQFIFLWFFFKYLFIL